MDSDSTKLRLLADWFDNPKIQTCYPEWNPLDDNEVQQDLRKIANRLDIIENSKDIT